MKYGEAAGPMVVKVRAMNKTVIAETKERYPNFRELSTAPIEAVGDFIFGRTHAALGQWNEEELRQALACVLTDVAVAAVAELVKGTQSGN